MKGNHIVVFPFMAKGHTVPLLHLATALASRRILITLITTPANAAFCRSSVDHPNIHIQSLPFPFFPPLPSYVESTDSLPSPDLFLPFLQATTLLHTPFNRLLVRLCLSEYPPIAVISDFFLGFTLSACKSLGIPRLVFHGMGVFSMAVCKALWTHLPDSTLTSFPVPGLPERLTLTHEEVPESVRMAGDASNPMTQFIAEVGAADVGSWGVLVNSFTEIDGDYLAPFEAFYRPGARAWLVGPLSMLSGLPAPPANECLKWLDSKEAGSVVYVSFGTQTHVDDGLLDEVAHGLVASGIEFLWVVRSPSWVTPPEVANVGQIERGWAPQREVLNHRAIGGFISHCGWNSVLESVAAGVPILAWPMMAEQTLNAKFVVEELCMGIALEGRGRDAICEGVSELMTGEKGKTARGKAIELRRAATTAVEDGGSSHGKLGELVDELRRVQLVNGVTRSGVLGEGLELGGKPITDDFDGAAMF